MYSTYLNTCLALVSSFLSEPGHSIPIHESQAPTTFNLPYSLVPMDFKHLINGTEFKFAGTAQQIIAQLVVQDPSFRVPQIEPALELSTATESGLAARSKDQIFCIPVPGQPWVDVRLRTLSESINSLLLLATLIKRCPVNARSCTKLSCENEAAIVLCNDNKYAIAPNCGYLASYAQDIYNRCQRWDFGWRDWVSGGQKFDTDNYNVIVSRRAKDC
ncbi:hypothetical protein BKA65DRAFT_413350 [Rhexocercosporidium sp. MPI-PUGE-AT-0058]|nr:hypothetical protein BKA65DRAFT_413350 [Rhexocercosporidium sp. MPI-PUGE-AT-0058]